MRLKRSAGGEDVGYFAPW